MEFIEVESNNLEAIAYDRKERKLYIRFRDGDRLYRYHNVPATVWKSLQEASSKGHFFQTQIKTIFDCERVDRR